MLHSSPGRFLIILQAPAQVEPSRWNLLWLFGHLATFFSYAHSLLSPALSSHWSCCVVIGCLLRTISASLWGTVLFSLWPPCLAHERRSINIYFGSSSCCVDVNAFNMQFHICFRHLLLHGCPECPVVHWERWRVWCFNHAPVPTRMRQSSQLRICSRTPAKAWDL